MIDKAGNIFGREPILFYGVVQAIILCITAFGLNLDAAQVGAINLLSLAVLSLLARHEVTPA